jgi:hypothetical protein
MTTETIFVVNWLSETNDGNYSGVAPKAFKTREEAKEHAKWVLEAERNDWLSRMSEDEFECDFERGEIHDNGYEEIFTVDIKEVDLCY